MNELEKMIAFMESLLIENALIDEWKELADNNLITSYVATKISFFTMESQKMLYALASEYRITKNIIEMLSSYADKNDNINRDDILNVLIRQLSITDEMNILKADRNINIVERGKKIRELIRYYDLTHQKH